MLISNLLYSVYERRLTKQLAKFELPKHVGVILDGNRRWATGKGGKSFVGHAAGAKKIVEFLKWCDDLDIPVRTLWLLSTENLQRKDEELAPLLSIIESAVFELSETGNWRIHIVGARELIPSQTLAKLDAAAKQTEKCVDKPIVNIAVAYGGRREVVDAIKTLLTEEAAAGNSVNQIIDSLSDEQISSHLYTKGQPDPDLVIRTSGEQRLSGFLLWQSAHSEFYFCEAYWPAFRRIDFLRALRSYTQRQRRFGL